jgi:outer membrane receptor protein involved in Fe transport
MCRWATTDGMRFAAFAIDLATGLEINGMTIAGEQDVPLENKERVEILKGIAGVESGVAAAGGLIDYVTKRPAAVKAVDLATDHRGTAYGASIWVLSSEAKSRWARASISAANGLRAI